MRRFILALLLVPLLAYGSLLTQGVRGSASGGGGGDPGNPLFFDDFDYAVGRNDAQASAEDQFQLAGWNAAGLSNGTGEDHGYLYTVTSIDGFGGTFPGTSPRALAMESYPNNGDDTAFLQADYWLQFGSESTGSPGDVPADLWVQFWIYLQDHAPDHVSTYPNRNKFLYPVIDHYPGNDDPGEGPITVAWLVVLGAQGYEADFGPLNENYIGFQAFGASKHVTLEPTENRLHQNLNSKRIAANEWTLVKLHIDISGEQGTFEAWIRAADEPSWTKISEWIGGVTSAGNFSWPTYPETRAGHQMIRTPTTENANPGNNPARDGDGDHTKYLKDFALDDTEADLPTYP
jgi:hypothetical protein